MTPRRTGLQFVAAALAVVAGVAHLLGTREHFREWAPGGWFFAAAGMAQAALAVAILAGRPRPARVAAAGIWVNVVVILTYVVSRTVGIPGAPPYSEHTGPLRAGQSFLPGALEPVRSYDLFVLFVEVVLVVALVELAGPAVRRHADLLSVLGAGLWLTALVRLVA